MFGFSDKGICYFAGEGDAPRIVRVVLHRRARRGEDRAARPRPSARRPGSSPATRPGSSPTSWPGRRYDLLADIAAVVTEPKVWSEIVVTRLAELRPDAYGPWGDMEPDARAAQLTAALKPFGVRTGQVWGTTDDGKGANRRGITRDDITNAITERDRKRGPDGTR